jgi:hypothetical protein
MAHSENKRAEKIMGKRENGTCHIDIPSEMGYICPICKNEAYHKNGEFFDERLHWSEYKAFLWCEKCDLDIPSCFCLPNLDTKEGLKKATDVFLDIIENAKREEK